ncbi:MAG: hypothetical protein LBQ18_01000 [Campylobacteraceae bacterium]|jgi:hypothetical protein|nr:hypothetical protein [Campylobacteraceae bacterium]
MRFMGKILVAAVAAGLFCNTLIAAENGFVARIGFGSSSGKTEVSSGGVTDEGSDRGNTFDIYAGYRMQNAQFGLSYAKANFDGGDANYILASGAYVVENLHKNIKPFLGLGFGLLNYEESDYFDESGLFGTVNLGVNVELDNFFFGAEFKQRIFGGIDEDIDVYYNGYIYTTNVKVEPKQTYLFYVGYKF